MTFERRGQLFCLSRGRVLIWRRLNKLNWKTNIEAAAESGKVGSTAYKKKRRSFSVCSKMMILISQLSCAGCFAVVWWGSSIRAAWLGRLAPWIWLQTSNWSCGEDKLLFIKILTLCIIYWTVSREPSLAGWFSSSSTRTDTGNVSYHISLHYMSVSQTDIYLQDNIMIIVILCSRYYLSSFQLL